MKKKPLNIGIFSQYLDNCTQVWFRMCPAHSKFLWNSFQSIISLISKGKNVSNYFKWETILI